MSQITPLVWLITGASNGFGLALCRRALKAGHSVVGTVRNKGRSAEAVKSIEQLGGKVIELDMTESQKSIINKIWAAETLYGKIDVLVNNAGYSLLGAVENFSDAETNVQMRTNFLGPLYAIQAVLPGMRARHFGTIVNVSSVGGQDGNPCCGLYAASKFALEGLSEALSKEMAEFGISVLIIEPGQFRTNFLNAFVLNEKGLSETYRGTVVDQAIQKFHSAAGKQIGNPDKAVNVIFEVVTGEGEAGVLKGKILRLPLGADALARIKGKMDRVNSDLDACWKIATATTFDD